MASLSWFMAALCLWASLAHADVELGAGYEIEDLGLTIPPSETHDARRSGPRIRVKLEELELTHETEHQEFEVLFIPLTVTAALHEDGISFGRVMDESGEPTRLQRVTGALVQTTYGLFSHRLYARAKMVSYDYNRDLGTWEWHPLDIAIGTRLEVGAGRTWLVLEFNAGAGVGELALRGLQDIEDQIGAENTAETTPIFVPEANARLAFRFAGFQIEASGRARARIDRATEHASYMGRESSFDSQNVRAELSVEQTLPAKFKRGVKVSVYALGAYEYDNLTLGRVLFGTRDDYEAKTLMGGLRARY